MNTAGCIEIFFCYKMSVVYNILTEFYNNQAKWQVLENSICLVTRLYNLKHKIYKNITCYIIHGYRAYPMLLNKTCKSIIYYIILGKRAFRDPLHSMFYTTLYNMLCSEQINIPTNKIEQICHITHNIHWMNIIHWLVYNNNSKFKPINITCYIFTNVCYIFSYVICVR